MPPMLLIHNKNSPASMNQTQDTGLSQEGYLERLLQEQRQQYQQKVQQQLSGNRNVNENSKDNVDISIHSSENVFVGRPSGNSSFSSGSNGTSPSPAMAISSSIGIGINHQQQQQQNRMMNYLQERQQQQQQQFMTGNIINGPSDISSNLGIAGLSSNIGLDSRLSGSGIGSGISANAWIDGFSRGALTPGTIAHPGASLYSSDQDLLMNAQRYQLAGNTIGTNILAINEGNGSITENHLTSLLGGLPQFCVPQQSLTSAQNSLNEAQKSNQKSYTDLFLAKQAQAALLQAAQARLPRTIRLPCGARGMKADHNSSTAYFDVPENARHGQHLLCSHSVCRAAGVKFRYCFYCKKPVTKQNFRSRHLHADLDPNNKKKDEKEANKKRKNDANKAEAKKVSDEETTKPNATDTVSTKTSGDDKDSIESSEAPPVYGSKTKLHNGTADKLGRPSKKSKLSILDGEKEYIRRDRWEELLQERPSDDLEEIHSWTRKVLSVSNPGLDSSVFGSIDVLKLQKQQQQGFPADHLPLERLSGHWNSLLDRRPKEDSNGSNFTNWLIQALELTNKYEKNNN